MGNICKKCGSNNIVMNGKQTNGKQKYHCKNCGCYRAFGTDFFYTDKRKEEILKVYNERPSLRGLTRIYGVSRTTVITWLKKKSYS
jgi:transposase-like protein